ncbi:MAG: hypothetical protein AAFV90_20280 [Cyanobacteria bacterium J06634_5]
MPVATETPLSAAKSETTSGNELASQNQPATIENATIENATIENAKIEEKMCWLEVKQSPYQPEHQVELLHLQAEADALIVKLQAAEQQQASELA